jgi:phosphoglycolate phosphatase-like HAD superfamily hydrolase
MIRLSFLNFNIFMQQTTFYALDFDGVICDSAIETGLTGWKAAHTLWDDMPEQAPAAMIEAFCQARPVIETGYEAILAVRLLYLGESVATLYRNPSECFKHLMQDAGVSVEQLKILFGQTRDAWIANDSANWVAMNPLFAGVAEKLRGLAQHCSWYIITTKQERFVKQILTANAIECSDEALFGLDCNLSKAQVLEQLLQQHPNQQCYFVEDRLPTLLTIKNNAALEKVNLLFALWGYNSADDKTLARQHSLQCITLDAFLSGL